MAVAWFTAGEDEAAEVRLARSGDGARTFASPRVVDADSPLGRVDVAILDDQSVLVLWVGKAAEDGRAPLLVRRFAPAAAAGEPATTVVVAHVTAERNSGFPRLASLGDAALVAWTKPGRRVAFALVTLVPGP